MRIAFTSAGAPRHGRNLSKLIQDISDQSGWEWETEFLEWQRDGYESYDFTKYDWLWNVGNFENVFGWMATLPESCKRIAMWVGTDILQHAELARRMPDPFAAAQIHIADAPNLVEEARQLTGLDVGYLRSIPPESYHPVPIQRWADILCYVPSGRDDFFRWGWILEVAKDYPSLVFHVLSRSGAEPELSNVIHEPEVQGQAKRELFERCFAFLRPIEHDGVGLTLIEMAQLGRFVFHSDVRIPFVLPARSIGEIEFHLDELLRRQSNPDPIISEFYRREYSHERLREDVERLRERMGPTL